MPGLKDHHIAQLATVVTNDIRKSYPMIPIPMSLRMIISEAIVRYLTTHDLKIDRGNE
jgi:hypothetical protein